MIHDIKLLNENEIVTLKTMMEHYKDHDKIDLLVELSLDPLDILKRKKITMHQKTADNNSHTGVSYQWTVSKILRY